LDTRTHSTREGRLQQFGRVVHGQNDHFRSRESFVNFACCFNAIHFRHGQIEHRNVRPVLSRQSHSFPPVRRLAAHFPTLLFQRSPHVAAD
jgi:hypothetical protein